MLSTFLIRTKLSKEYASCGPMLMLMFRPWSQKGLDLSSASATYHPCDLGQVITSMTISFLICEVGIIKERWLKVDVRI